MNKPNMRIAELLNLARDDYQKIRVLQNGKILFEGELFGFVVQQELKNTLIKSWAVNNGVMVFEVH